MGLFHFLKKNDKREEQSLQEEDSDKTFEEKKKEKVLERREFKEDKEKTKEKIVTTLEQCNNEPKTEAEAIQCMRESCEQVGEANRQIENAKIEYQAVTDYLTDIQKLDLLEPQQRATLEEAARKIITLTRERADYQNSQVRTSNPKFRGILRYEKDMLQEIKHLRENEDYNRMIKNDMRHLEAEKASLFYEKKEIIGKQTYLKKLSWITFVIAGSLFLLFFTLANALEVSMVLPYIMTVAMAAVLAGYIFWEASRNRIQMVIVEKKLNKAIALLNKVKIKYINNTGTLEYGYSKFGVESVGELQYLWEQYTKAREAERTYQSNTDRLSYYRESLLAELSKLSLADCEIWMYQAAAILDQKEMVEIRHKLNVRRQKLREKIEYNTKIKDTCLEEIHAIIEKRPQIKQEVADLLQLQGILE